MNYLFEALLAPFRRDPVADASRMPFILLVGAAVAVGCMIAALAFLF